MHVPSAARLQHGAVKRLAGSLLLAAAYVLAMVILFQQRSDLGWALFVGLPGLMAFLVVLCRNPPKRQQAYVWGMAAGLLATLACHALSFALLPFIAAVTYLFLWPVLLIGAAVGVGLAENLLYGRRQAIES